MTPARLTCLSLVCALAACTEQAPDRSDAPQPTIRAAELDSPRARASYMVGLDLARDVAPIREDIDLDLAQRAMRASLSGEQPLLDATQLEGVRKEFTEQLRDQRAARERQQATRNAEEGAKFLAANARKPEVITTASGLQYQVLKAGAGAKPTPTGTVSVHYVGRTLNGPEFANTYTVQHPATLPLTRVMPGLAEGVALMPLGSRYRFWIPAKLGYGEAGRPGEIEPNATLVFDVQLLEIAGAPSRQ